MIGAVARKLFGSANDRRIRSYQPRVSEINALEKSSRRCRTTRSGRAPKNSRSRWPKAPRSTTF